MVAPEWRDATTGKVVAAINAFFNSRAGTGVTATRPAMPAEAASTAAAATLDAAAAPSSAAKSAALSEVKIDGAGLPRLGRKDCDFALAAERQRLTINTNTPHLKTMIFRDIEHCAGVRAAASGGLIAGAIRRLKNYQSEICEAMSGRLRSRRGLGRKNAISWRQNGDARPDRIARSPDCDKNAAIPHVQNAIGPERDEEKWEPVFRPHPALICLNRSRFWRHRIYPMSQS